MSEIDRLTLWSTSNANARELALAFASCGEGIEEVTVDEVEANIQRRQPEFRRRNITAEMRVLENLGLGRLITGRRNAKSRFVSNEGIRRIGKLALGQPTKAVGHEDPNVIYHRFALRPDFEVTLPLPRDLNRAEADRLIAYIQLLPFNHYDS